MTKSDKELLRKLDMEHRAKLTKQSEGNTIESKAKVVVSDERNKQKVEKGEEMDNQQSKITTKPNPKSKQKVNTKISKNKELYST